MNALRDRYTYVFTTGGIGPTHDDITADSIAKAFGVGIDVDERALAPMKAYFERRGVELTPARLRMARIPFGAELVENSVSIAPGFMLGNVIVMAGIPAHHARDAGRGHQVPQDRQEDAVRRARPAPARGRDRRHVRGRCRSAIRTCRWAAIRFIRDGKPGTQLVLRSTDAARLAAAENELKVLLVTRGWL